MDASAFACPLCEASVEIAAFLSSITGYDRVTSSAASVCPACGKTLEFKLRGRALVLGYTYWSGSPHFEGMIDVPVKGLRFVAEQGGCHYEFRGERFEVPGGGSEA